MTHILHLDSSPNGPEESFSRRLSAGVVRGLREAHPGAEVTYLDLAAAPPPHIDGALRAGWTATPDRRTPDQVTVVARSEGYVATLKAADILVVGAPMYNFSVPSPLKAWIDHVCIAGQTFRYTPQGPQGLLKGRRAYLALSRGGVYTEGPFARLDHQESYLRAVLGFMGLGPVEAVFAEGVAKGPDKAAEALDSGLARAAELTAAA